MHFRFRFHCSRVGLSLREKNHSSTKNFYVFNLNKSGRFAYPYPGFRHRCISLYLTILEITNLSKESTLSSFFSIWMNPEFSSWISAPFFRSLFNDFESFSFKIDMLTCRSVQAIFNFCFYGPLEGVDSFDVLLDMNDSDYVPHSGFQNRFVRLFSIRIRHVCPRFTCRHVDPCKTPFFGFFHSYIFNFLWNLFFHYFLFPSFQSVTTRSQRGEKEKESFVPDHSEDQASDINVDTSLMDRTKKQVRAARTRHQKKSKSLVSVQDELHYLEQLLAETREKAEATKAIKARSSAIRQQLDDLRPRGQQGSSRG